MNTHLLSLSISIKTSILTSSFGDAENKVTVPPAYFDIARDRGIMSR